MQKGGFEPPFSRFTVLSLFPQEIVEKLVDFLMALGEITGKT